MVVSPPWLSKAPRHDVRGLTEIMVETIADTANSKTPWTSGWRITACGLTFAYIIAPRPSAAKVIAVVDRAAALRSSKPSTVAVENSNGKAMRHTASNVRADF